MVKTFEDIVKTTSYICNQGYSVSNQIIHRIDINVIAHFGNCVCLEIFGEGIRIYRGYNNTANIGFILRELVEFFGISKEDGLKISEIHNVPCRIIIDPYERCVGFGHFLQDKFIMNEDLNTIGRSVVSNE